MRKTRKNTIRKGKRSHQRRRRAQTVGFEALETRQLLATINVVDYGARVNDGGDDVGAIQAAINASKAGDTIYFPAGAYNLSRSVITKGEGRSYLGQNNAVLWAPSDKHGFYVDGGATIRNLIFEGRGIKIEKNPWYATNILIDGCTIRNVPREGPDKASFAIFAVGAADTTVRNTKIQNAQFAWMSYGFRNLTIENNVVEDCGYGFKCNFGAGQQGLVIRGNILRRIQRSMGMEIEGGAGTGAGNILIENNAVVDHVLGDSHDARNNLHAFGISCVASVAANVVVRNNYISGPADRWPTGLRMGIEAAGGLMGGTGPIYENNWVEYAGESIGLTTSLNAVIRNNLIRNCKYGPRIQAPANGSAASATAQWINNGPNVQLPASGGWTLVGKTPPGVTPNPNPNPNPTPAPEPAPVPSAPTNLRTVATGATQVSLFWKDTAYNEDGFKVERSTDATNWTQVAQPGANATSYTAGGLTTGTNYLFRVRAFNSDGHSGYSNTASAKTAVAEPTTGVYLSDLQWVSAKNGWGPVERDMSNGETDPSDGRQLTINGKTYDKGLGVHASSEIKYRLDGKYARFLAEVGIDDEAESRGSVEFEVWADGVRLLASGRMTGETDARSIDVNVSGRKELMLVVTNADDNINWDHADWGNARLIPAVGNPLPDPTPVPNPDPEPLPQPVRPAVYLSDLDWTDVRNGWGVPELDKSNGERKSGDGNTLTLNGKTYEKGIGVHADSRLVYDLGGRYATFVADIGVDDEVGDNGSVVFQVWTDGVVLYDSGVMTGASATRTINVNVQGRKELWLVVTNAGDNKNNDHADWANALLTVPAGVSVPKGTTYLSDLSPLSQKNGWGPAEFDRSNGETLEDDGRIIRLNGTTYAKGIGVHAGSELVFNLAGRYRSFLADVGVDDEVGSLGSVVFQIFGDGVKLFDSGVMTGQSATRKVEVNVAGTKQLWLVVSDAGDGIGHDHADWANACLVA